MTAHEVEELITIPMEDPLRGTPWIEYVRSSSVVGLSQVTLIFKMGVELMQARQQVQERLKLAIAELPQSSGMPVMLQPLSSTSRVMKIFPCAAGLQTRPRSGRLEIGPGRREEGDGTALICPSPQGRGRFPLCSCQTIRLPGADTRCRIVAMSGWIGTGRDGTTDETAGANFPCRCSRMRGKFASRKGFAHPVCVSSIPAASTQYRVACSAESRRFSLD